MHIRAQDITNEYSLNKMRYIMKQVSWNFYGYKGLFVHEYERSIFR